MCGGFCAIPWRGSPPSLFGANSDITDSFILCAFRVACAGSTCFNRGMTTNRYAGTCATCHERVSAGQGYYDGVLWCAEPVRYEGMTMCPTAARWQAIADTKAAERRATYVAPEPTPEEVARRNQYAARATAWEAEGKRECGRCGGNGGSHHWPGFTCYGCEGRGYKTA